MNKLNKNFNSNGVTVESMACTLTCSCGKPSCKVQSCSCNTVSDYYGYNPLSSSSYTAVFNANYQAIDNEVYEMHYLG